MNFQNYMEPTIEGAFAMAKIQGDTNILCYVDSGACVSLIQPELVRELGLEINLDTKPSLALLDKSPLTVQGTVTLDLEIAGRS